MTDIDTLTGMAGHLAATSSLNQVSAVGLLKSCGVAQLEQIRKLSTNGYEPESIEYIFNENLDIERVLNGDIIVHRLHSWSYANTQESLSYKDAGIPNRISAFSVFESVLFSLMGSVTRIANWLMIKLSK